MKFEVGEVESKVKSFDLFMGPIVYEVVAINPNLEKLHEIGLTFMKQEPEYIRDFNGTSFVEINFWLKAINETENNQLLPLKFLISKDDMPIGSNSGKYKFIDNTGRTAWAAKPEDLVKGDWFHNTEARVIKKGEEEMYRFIHRWLNINSKKTDHQECRYDIDKLLKGDFSEINKHFNEFIIPKQEEAEASYCVYVLTGISSRESNGKQYHNLIAYNKQFYNDGNSADFVGGAFQTYIEKSSYNSFGTDAKPVAFSYDIKTFDPKMVTPDANIEAQEDNSEDQLPF